MCFYHWPQTKNALLHLSKFLPNVTLNVLQYTIPGPITLRRGDAVYVRAENGKNLIAQIDTMWTAPE